MSFGRVKEVRLLAVPHDSIVQSLDGVGFGHVVDLVGPLAVFVSLDDYKTVFVDVGDFLLEVLGCVFVGEKAVV